MINLLKVVSIFVSLFFVSISYANVSATVSQTHFEENETFDLTLHLDNFNTKPDLASLNKDFTVYNNTTSSQTDIINNKKTSKYEMIITLMPNKSGKLTIPAINIGNESTKPINITVNNDSSKGEINNHTDIFAVGNLAKNTGYVNSPIIYNLKIYYSTPILNLQAAKAFKINGANVEQIGKANNHKENVDGTIYDVLEQNFLVLPQKTGKLKIPPFALVANIPNGFGELGTKTRYFHTKEKTLNIYPIPNDISIKDWLPASNVKLTDDWSKKTGIKEGDLITRIVKIKASGISSRDIPRLNFKSSKNFNVYAEKPKLKDSEENGHLVATATYKIGYIPIKHGKVTVPDVKLKWYDIDDHKSEIATLTSKGFNIAKGNLTNTNFYTTPKLENSDKKLVSSFWRNIAIVFIVLWLITLFLLLRCKFSKQKPSTKMENLKSININKKENGKLKDIKKACKLGNNSELQKTLIAWANSEFKIEIFSLLEIVKFVPELESILKKLNSSIYAGKEFDQYDELYNLLSNLDMDKKQKKVKKQIKGLYD